MTRVVISRVLALLLVVGGAAILPAPAASAIGAFTFTTSTLAFPDTIVGSSSVLTVGVINTSGVTQSVSIPDGAPADALNFGILERCGPGSGPFLLPPGGSCGVIYAFHPVSVGAHTTTAAFTVNGVSSGTITLSGTGTPTFDIAPTTVAFADTAVGAASGRSVQVTNLSSTTQPITSVFTSGGLAAPFSLDFEGCTGASLAPGNGCVFSYSFRPTATGSFTATDGFSINGQPSGPITLTGTGVQNFSITPTTLTFPATVVGDTSAGIDVTITNTSGVSQTLTSVAGGAPIDAANFTGVQNCATVTLAPGASCAFTYTFTPTTTGPRTTTTSFSINGQTSGTITLTGTGTPTFSITPTTLTFPATVVGDTSAGIDVTVTNLASTPQTLTAVAGGAPIDAANFTGVQNCATVTLAPGASCAFTYTFTPTTTGPRTTTTSFSINGQTSGTITLTGTGTAFQISSTSLNFPNTEVGFTSAPMSLTVTNLTSTSQTLSVSGGSPLDPTHFAGTQDCDGITLAPGASCAFTYTFAPKVVGLQTTTTQLTITAGGTLAAGSAGRSTGISAAAAPSLTQESGVITLSGTGIEFTSPTPTPTQTPDPLPTTGSNLGFPLSLALAALLLGLAFLRLARRSAR